MKSLIPIALLMCVLPATCQTFSSGSNGSDGDFILPALANGQTSSTIVFDPNDKTLFPNGADADHDNVYHFKKITIPAGVHLILRADKLGGPIYWLAQGDVLIQGWIDLDGSPGAPGGTVAQTYAIPGPGGFYGGGGGDNGSRPPTDGLGPAPGAAGNPKTYDGSCTGRAGGGGYSGNIFLVPLIGGSGGGGMFDSYPSLGPGGGAGGGAILIASSGTITVAASGTISARGGGSNSNGYYPPTPYADGQDGSLAGSGAGGSIRLAANIIAGSGYILVAGFRNYNCGAQTGAGGRVRLEAFQEAFTGTVDGDLRAASPFATFVPTSVSAAVKVLTVNGVNVNANPSGSFTVPDVTITAAAAVPVTIEVDNVPSGTVVHLQIFSENGPSQAVDFPALSGAGPTFKTTTNIAFPTGFSQGFVQASFTQ